MNFKDIKTEGDVDSKFVNQLLNKMGYDQKNIFFKENFKFTQGSKKTYKEVDVLVRLLEENMFIIESKAPNVTLNKYIEQADFYAFGLSTKYSLITNSKRIVLRGYDANNKKKTLIDQKINTENWESVINSLREYIGINKVKRNADFKIGINNNVQEIERNFALDLKRIHNIIRKKDKLDPNDAFAELSKLLFIKISEEHLKLKNRYTYSAFIEAQEKDMAKIYIGKIFSDAISQFPKIFNRNEEILLSDKTIIQVIQILEKYDIYELPIDIKGKAFESFLSTTLRGKGLGQFFTPREIVKFIVNSVEIKYDDVVLDLACGTGGFLISAFNHMINLINKQPKNILSQEGKEKQIDYIRNNNFFGIDAEPKASRVAKMNMAIWGDGENVFRGNGLDTKDITGNKYPFIKKGVDLILMNPPFGTEEEEEEILALYNMSNFTKKTQTLFLERALDLLNENGRIAMVIPDSILTGTENENLRHKIIDEVNVKAIVSLPKIAFKVSGADVATSIIFLDKKINSEKVMLFDAEDIGYDAAGRQTRKNNIDTDLDVISKIISGKKEISTYNNSLLINKNMLRNSKRWDAPYFILNNKLNLIAKKWVPLSTWIEKTGKSIIPSITMEESMFSILKVSNEKGIHIDSKKENIFGIDIDIKYKMVSSDSISFNPYRVNVGSIGVIPKNTENLLISNAYPVFKVNEINPSALVFLMKTNFYKKYLDVVGTGSVRNNVTASIFEEILVPNDIKFINSFKDFYDKDTDLNNNKIKNMNKINDCIEKSSYFKNQDKTPPQKPKAFQDLLNKAINPDKKTKDK